MKLLYITAISLFVVVVSLLTVRFWGLGQRFTPYDNGFFNGASSTIRSVSDPLLAENDIVWLNVVLNDRGDLAIEADTSGLLLKDYLSANPTRKSVININENKFEIQKLLGQIIKETNSAQRVIVQSLFKTILESTKVEVPNALYGTSQPDLLKFAAMEALFILPAVPFKGDVFIAPLKLMKRPSFSGQTLEEVRRRNKRIVIGPISNSEELKEALSFAPDFIYLTF